MGRPNTRSRAARIAIAAALERPAADYQLTSGSHIGIFDKAYLLSTTSTGQSPGRLPAGHHDHAPPRFEIGGDPELAEPWKWRPEEELTAEEEAVLQLLAQGKTQVQAAGELGIAEAQARRRYERGREKLRKRLARRAAEIEGG